MIRRDRIGGGVAALLLQAGILYGLYLGLIVRPGNAPREAAMVLITPVDPPAAVPERKPALVARPRAKAAPPARRAISTPIVVPPPVVPPLAIPLIVTAPIAGISIEPVTGGAAAGTGTGAAGQGDGTGAGGAGDGTGGGGTPAQWLRGRIRGSDYPEEAVTRQMQGALVTRYNIGTNGRVTDCAIVESSGSAVLDSTTCRLVKQRFRYRPARDAAGRKVVSTRTEDHHWVIEPDVEEEPPAAGGDAPRPR